MHFQILEDNQGKQTGIFIPMEDWATLKNNYPDIDSIDADLPEWQKSMLDERLQSIAHNPASVKPIQELFEELDREL